MASPPIASTFSRSVLSSIRWSARKLRPHLVHSELYSLKFSRCPEALNTISGLIRGASISRKPCLLVKCSLQDSSMFLLSLVPRSPYVTKPLRPP